jgi:hypothetical protein
MIRRVALAVTAAAVITGSAVAAPAAHASIQQPSCWGRAVKCLTATPAATPDLHYHAPPDVHYHAPPNTHYHAPPNLGDQGEPPPPVHYHT